MVDAVRSELEPIFATQCRQFNLTPEEQFKLPHLRYVWDFAFPEVCLLIELNGGTKMSYHNKKSAHATPTGIQRDYNKANAAAQASWWQLTFSTDDVKTGKAILAVKQFLTTHPPF